MNDPQSGSCLEVSQEKAFEDLEEIPEERNTKEDLHCTPSIQKLTGTDKLATEDTVPMLL